MSRPTQIYMDHSQRSKSPWIYVPAMGVNERMPPGLIKHGGAGSKHPCLVMLFHNRADLLAPNHKDWLSASGEFVIWPYEAYHLYGNNFEDWNHSWLHVSGQWIDRKLSRTSIPLGIPIHLDEQVTLRYLKLLIAELRGRVQQDPDMLERILEVFWYEVERHIRASPATRRIDPRLEKAREYIEATFDQPFSLDETARQAHLSPSHFCSLFSREFGVPPREYGMRLRLQRGAQLLANRTLAIFEVAEMTGCSDALYFSRLFKKRYGMSPAEFRKHQCPEIISHPDPELKPEEDG